MSFKRSRANFEADQNSSHQPSFVFYGTALPPLDSDTRDDGSYVPVWKQEVRDERGRKRLHGAFTGGFSAGYFNTVGSKEGFTPSTFVSSKSNRAKDASKQRMEDFMDAEDMADLEDSQKLQVQGAFAGLGGIGEGSSQRGFMTDLFRTNGDTMGIKLLQRMGWRQGQGIGPRIRRKARNEEGTDEKSGETHLFAPDDTRMVSFDRKTDRFGLGFSREGRLGADSQPKMKSTTRMEDSDEDDNMPFSRNRKPLKPKVKKSGLGVGVLNDTGSDDEDPYEIGPKISYNRVIGGDKKKRKGGIVATSTIGKTPSRTVFLSQKLTNQAKQTGFRRCHDGKLPLDGFVLASAPLVQDQENKYPPPPVPEGWKPSRLAESTSTDSSNWTSTADAARSSTLDPSARAALLGETALPGKSIFDFISSAARDKLAQASGRVNLPQGRGEAAPEGFRISEVDRQKTLWDLVPRLDPKVAQAALDRGTSGWMPYAEDAAKRSRYRSFLESMTGQRHDLPERVAGSSTEEWTTEMREFSQAAQVFKPISGLMASRFTSSKVEGPKLASDHPDAQDDAGGLRGREEVKKDPAEEAASLGMFGPMTRSRIDFYPTRLTCKRFGIKPPAHVVTDPGAEPDGGDERGQAERSRDSRLDVVGKESLEAMMREAAKNRFGHAAATTDMVGIPAQDAAPQPVPQVSTQVVDVERNEALEGQRAGEELFKSIFGDDDDE
ncbi:hypothetical protein MBLNU457_5743t1 [Dothideomycetes sp. NU457]